ncbi:SDR family oxidoreductase [bacterium]|nr:MAG: SDR family oxidoreductase [bacterium]
MNLFGSDNNDEKRPSASQIKAEQLPYPASQEDMKRQPQSDLNEYKPAGKLLGKVALITGGDSGIGRAVAMAFVMEGAKVAIIYNENTEDAEKTVELCAQKGGECLAIKADIREPQRCQSAVGDVIRQFGDLNILVNNAHYQMAHEDFGEIPEEDLRRTVETNILGTFWMTQYALKHLKDGDSIINTGSIVGKTGNPILVDYASTKGAIHAFTRSLAFQLGPKNIRVNSVVPGPVWTPNIPGTMPKSEVKNFGHEVALARPGQPEELAPVFVLLASSDGSFMTGALVDVTGGKMSSDG